MKLFNSKTGAEVFVGDIVTDFRGDKAEVTGFQPPAREGSSGRVHVKDVGSGCHGSYYPSVYGLEIK